MEGPSAEAQHTEKSVAIETAHPGAAVRCSGRTGELWWRAEEQLQEAHIYNTTAHIKVSTCPAFYALNSSKIQNTNQHCKRHQEIRKTVYLPLIFESVCASGGTKIFLLVDIFSCQLKSRKMY